MDHSRVEVGFSAPQGQAWPDQHFSLERIQLIKQYTQCHSAWSPGLTVVMLKGDTLLYKFHPWKECAGHSFLWLHSFRLLPEQGRKETHSSTVLRPRYVCSLGSYLWQSGARRHSPSLSKPAESERTSRENRLLALSPTWEIILWSGTLLGNYPTVSLRHYEQLNVSENHLAENVICPRFEIRECFS